MIDWEDLDFPPINLWTIPKAKVVEERQTSTT